MRPVPLRPDVTECHVVNEACASQSSSNPVDFTIKFGLESVHLKS